MQEHDVIRALSGMKERQDSFFMAHVKTGASYSNRDLKIVIWSETRRAFHRQGLSWL